MVLVKKKIKKMVMLKTNWKKSSVTPAKMKDNAKDVILVPVNLAQNNFYSEKCM